MLTRRNLLAASGAALAAPSLSRAASSSVMKFIPQSDLTVLDPIWPTAYVTRNHGLMVFDTLYGIDSTYAGVVQIRLTPKTRNPFTIRAISISGVTRK